MTRSELETKVRQQAGDLIYCWLLDEDYQYLKEYRPEILFDKRDKQLSYLKGLAYAVTGGGSAKDEVESQIFEWVKDEIRKTYQQIRNPKTMVFEDASPRLVIAALMVGDTVRGKNWKQGIYGCSKVGAVGTDMTALSLGNLASGNAPLVDTSWSQQYQSYKVVPQYDLSISQYQPTEVSLVDTKYNYVNNWGLNKETGLYEFKSVSDGNITLGADGAKVSQNQLELWTNVTNAIKQIQGLVNGFAEFLSGLTAADALMPAQVNDGWVAPSGAVPGSINAGVSTGLLIGGALLAAGFISNDKKRK